MSLLDANFWNQQYLSNNTGWDMGMVSPPLKKIIDQLDDKNSSILIPGCGNAYEAQYLLDNGFTNITLIDIAPSLVAKLQERWNNNPNIQVIEGDFFKLEKSFDVIIEQTFFCALNSSLRRTYAKKIDELLNPNGQLIGILFSKEFEKQGPPFGGSVEEYETIFSPFFVTKFSPCYDSHPKRMGSECWVSLHKTKK